MAAGSQAAGLMSDNERVSEGGLRIARIFHDFVEHELLPEIGFRPDEFWQGLEAIFTTLTPTNEALLARRRELQQTINAWHDSHPGSDWSHDDYVEFL
jgi:malate synthase